MSPATRPLRLLMVRPTLGQGGADRVTHTLLASLPRDTYSPSLALLRPRGEFLSMLPGDVAVHSLGDAPLWRATPPLARLVARERPDVLFSTSTGTNVVAVLAHRLARSRSRLVLSERNRLDRVERSWKYPALNWMKRRTYRMADVVTVVSQGVAREVVEQLGVPPELVQVVYNPVVTPDLAAQATQPVDHPWFSEDPPIVLGCGRLVPQKDFSTLLRAFARVHASLPARLVILGEGSEDNRLRELAEQIGIGHAVWFAGFDINPFRYMARSTCFALSSRHEGLPGALIQAMACGAAVVSTDCPHGPSEIISDGVDGVLCPVGDVTALAEAIRGVLSDPARRRRLGDAARESAQRFDVTTSVSRYITALSGPGTSTRPQGRR